MPFIKSIACYTYPTSGAKNRDSIRLWVNTGAKSLLAVIVVCLLLAVTGCATLQSSWQQKTEKSAVTYYTRASKVASIPEFKATVEIKAPISDVITTLTDFSSHPQWVYGCQQSEVLGLNSLSDAYVYQVTKIPLLKDRDTIMHATIKSSNGGNRVLIRFKSSPNYCDDKDTSKCDLTKDNNYVRVQDAMGTFLITAIDSQTTAIEWTQFLDPAGALPHWLFRSRLSQVPIKSLNSLKELVESDTDFQ